MAQFKYILWGILNSSTQKKSQIEEVTSDSNDCEARKEYKKRRQKLNKENECGKLETKNQTTELVLLTSPNHIKLMPSGYLKNIGPYDIFWKALESENFKMVGQKTDHLNKFLAYAERCYQDERNSSSKQLAQLEYNILFFVQALAIDSHMKKYSLTKALHQILVFLRDKDLPNKTYIESVIYNWLTRTYISKSKLGKAVMCSEITRPVVELCAPSRWTSLALEGEAMIYLAQADIYPKVKSSMYQFAYDRYRLAFHHSSEQNPRIVHPRDHYLVKMLYIKLQMPKLLQNTLASLDFHQFERCKVSREDVRTAQNLLRTLEQTYTEDPKHGNSLHLLVCDLSIALRMAQLFILEKRFSDARQKLYYVYSVIKWSSYGTSDNYDVHTLIVKQLSDLAEGLAHTIPSLTCDFEEEQKMVFAFQV